MAVTDNAAYTQLRDSFLKKNEGFKTTVYFDTLGIATVATGVALV
jgi:GH24 family phage-related lysozyme (muramidase)